MYAVTKDGTTLGRFPIAEVLPSGVLEARKDRKSPPELSLAPGMWDSLVWEDPDPFLKTEEQWGVALSEPTDGSGFVVSMFKNKHEAMHYRDQTGGALVHRQVGPWTQVFWRQRTVH